MKIFLSNYKYFDKVFVFQYKIGIIKKNVLYSVKWTLLDFKNINLYYIFEILYEYSLKQDTTTIYNLIYEELFIRVCAVSNFLSNLKSRKSIGVYKRL